MLAGNRITHLFDCADVGSTLVREAKRQQLPWRQVQGPWTRGGTRIARYRFFAELAGNYPRTQLWHVHMGGRAKWARGRFERPYVLTLHGTDIRQTYWQDEHRDVLKRDIDLAKYVFYTTPDLREKAERARRNAEYMPIALDFAALPDWAPALKPRIFFPSRWSSEKGGDGQIEVASAVAAAVGDRADIVGLDWGDRATEAAQVGVQLIPKMDVAGFLSEMATAHVTIGQTTGLLGTSELQAMAIGVPLIFTDPVEGYPTGDIMGALVCNKGEVAAAALELLQDPPAFSRKLGGQAYTRRHHSPGKMVRRLETVYDQVLSGATA